MVALMVTGLSYGQSSDLYFSMYGEGSSNNKFFEIYNGTGSDVDLVDYSLELYANGATTPTNTLTFTTPTVITDGDVYVVYNSSSVAAISDNGDIAATVTFFNGDDAIALLKNGTAIDIIGIIGEDPGSAWTVAGISGATANHTMTRKSTICDPTTDWVASAGTDAASSQWVVTDVDTEWENIGSFTGCVAGPILSIFSPTEGQVLPDTASTTMDVTFTVSNFTVATAGNGDGHLHYSVDGGANVMKFDTDPITLTGLALGDHTIYMELVDDNHDPLDPAVNQTVNFSIAILCDLGLTSNWSDCDTFTGGTDTYTANFNFIGGNTGTTYSITVNTGTVSGDDPSSVAEGTITVTGASEGTDTTISVTGGACDLSKTELSPACDPGLTLPIYEDFAYADGSLIDAPDWNSFSGTSGDLLVASGQAVVQHGTPSEDAGLAFTPISGDVYYAFDFSVTDPGGVITGGDYEYFAMFKDDGYTYKGRIDIVEATSGGDYTVGIATSNSTADAIWATDLSFDTTYRATARYNQDTNIAELWIDAASSSDTSILGADEDDPGTSISQFGLRQSDSSLNEAILVDNLALSQTFDETLSISSNQIEGFGLYPNPITNGVLNITTQDNLERNIQIFDVLGKQVFAKTTSTNTINVANLNAGIYIIKVEEANRIATRKLVIE